MNIFGFVPARWWVAPVLAVFAAALARTEAVYGKLFGWTFRKIGDGDDACAGIFLGVEPMAGMVRVPPKSDECKPELE